MKEECICLIKGVTGLNSVDSQIKEAALQNLRLLQAEKGISFFGHTGAGKSTLLNELLGNVELLPTKDRIVKIARGKGIRVDVESFSTSACVVEVVRRRPGTVPGLVENDVKISLKLVSRDEWKTKLRGILDSLRYANSCTQMSAEKKAEQKILPVILKELFLHEFDLISKQWQPVSDFEYTEEWLTRTIESCDNSVDPVAGFLADENNREKIIIGGETAFSLMRSIASGLHGLSLILTSVKAEGYFPKSSLLFDVPLFDLPGSGDPIRSRETARRKARSRAKWGVFVCGQSWDENTQGELMAALECTDKLIIVKSRHFDGLSNTIEDMSVKDIQEYLQDAAELVLETVQDSVRAWHINQTPGEEFPALKVFVTSQKLNDQKLPEESRRVCAEFRLSQIDGIFRQMRALVEGSDNYFLNSARAISSLLSAFMSGAESAQAINTDRYILAPAPFRQKVLDALRELPQDVLLSALRNMYNDMNQKCYHVRMREWAFGSGRATVNGDRFNTPEVLAASISNHLRQQDLIQQALQTLKKEIPEFAADKDGSHVIATFWITLTEIIEPAVFDQMQSFYFNPRNPYDAYRSAEDKSSLFLDRLCELCVQNWDAVIDAISNEATEKGFAKIQEMCDTFAYKSIEHFRRNNPPVLLHVNKNFSPEEVRNIRLCLDAAKLLTAAEAQSSSKVEENFDEQILEIRANIVLDGNDIVSKLSGLSDKHHSVEVLVLRFLGLKDTIIQSNSFFNMLRKFRNLRAVDLSGSPDLKWDTVSRLHQAFPTIGVYCRFCFYQTPLNPSDKIFWNPLLGSAEIFKGKRVGIVVAESVFQSKRDGSSRDLPSAARDGALMATVMTEKGFGPIQVKSLRSKEDWEEVKGSVLSLLPQDKTEPIAFFFAIFGHGAQNGGVPVIETSDGNIVSVGDIYNIISIYAHPDSTCCFVFGTCQEAWAPLMNAPAPRGSVLLRMARNGEYAFTLTEDNESNFVRAIKRASSSSAPLFEFVSNAAMIYLGDTGLSCEVSHTVIPLSLRWW